VRRIGLVILLGALSAFGPMSIDMYLPAFPAISARFHAGPRAWPVSRSASCCTAR
jgi:DHA1 family bicyclomycin/chloramphenicol resistance-like MFS transporter